MRCIRTVTNSIRAVTNGNQRVMGSNLGIFMNFQMNSNGYITMCLSNCGCRKAMVFDFILVYIKI